MSSSQPNPSLGLSITSEQRDRAEALLKDAYADGRIDELQFDNRIDQVLAATTRKDLNEAFFGLVDVPTPSAAPEAQPAQPQVSPVVTGQQSGRGAAGFAHFSVFLLWLLGPGVVFALSPAGSYARREAAKAFNFQLVSAIVLVPLYIIAGINGFYFFDWLLSLIGTGWLILTIVGGVKAAKGELAEPGQDGGEARSTPRTLAHVRAHSRARARRQPGEARAAAGPSGARAAAGPSGARRQPSSEGAGAREHAPEVVPALRARCVFGCTLRDAALVDEN